jgi:hypothetical protein
MTHAKVGGDLGALLLLVVQHLQPLHKLDALHIATGQTQVRERTEETQRQRHMKEDEGTTRQEEGHDERQGETQAKQKAKRKRHAW